MNKILTQMGLVWPLWVCGCWAVGNSALLQRDKINPHNGSVVKRAQVKGHRGTERKVRTTRSGHGSRGGGAKVADLKHQPHSGIQGDPLITGQSQHLTGRRWRFTHTAHRCDWQRMCVLVWITSPVLLSSLYTKTLTCSVLAMSHISSYLFTHGHTHMGNLLTPCCHPWLCWVTQSTLGRCLHPGQST